MKRSTFFTAMLLLPGFISLAQETVTTDTLPARTLESVEVTAKKRLYEQRPEGTIVHVGSSLMSKGSSVLQLLERSPGVTIDRRNGNILLQGKAEVLILLNGRPIRLSPEQAVELLNGMSGNEVTRIELLSTPPAGYDAQGAGGVINIITSKSARPGLSGSLSLSAGYGWKEKLGANANLAYNTNRLRLYGSYAFARDRGYSEIAIASAQNMPVFGGPLSVLAWDTTKAVRNGHDAVLGADLHLDTRTTLGYSVTLNHSLRNALDLNRTDFFLPADSLLFFSGDITSKSRWNNWLHGIYLEKQVREGEKWSINGDWLRFNNQSPSIVSSTFNDDKGKPVNSNDTLFSPQQRGFAGTAISVGVLKADYEKQWTKKWTMQAGGKATVTRTSSQSGIESLTRDEEWVSRSETFNNARMRETIGAGYGSLEYRYDSATTLTMGLRYEYWKARVTDPGTGALLVNREQGRFFPNLLFAKKLNRNNELQFSLSSRISRPSYNDLASFVRYSDPTAIYTGNTLLKSSASHTVKVGYNYRRYAFSVSLGREDNPIVRYQITENPERNLLLVAPQNLRYKQDLTLQASLPFSISNWWTMNYTITGSLNKFQLAHTAEQLTKSYLSYSLNMNQSFVLPAQFSAELSGWYNNRSYNGSVKVDGMGALNMGLKKQWRKKGGSLQLTVEDILRTMQFNTYYGTLTREAFDITNHVNVKLESARSPIIKLTYTRPIGGGTIARSSRKPQETERVNY